MQARILVELGIARRWLGEHQAARAVFEEAVRLFGETGDFRWQAEALLELGQLLRATGMTAPAYEAYQRAASVAQRYDAPGLRRRAFNGLAALALHNNRVVDALELLEQALAATSDDEPDGQTLSLLGMAHLRAGHSDQSVHYQQAALDWFRQEGDYPRQARALLRLGLAHHALGKMQEALDALNQAMELMRPLGDALGQARLLTNLGTLYAEQDRWQEAFDTWRDAFVLQSHLADQVGMATTLYNLGDLAWRMGHSEEAQRHFEQSRWLAERLNLLSLVNELEQHPINLL
jgi:tetratricopeptide (TPR) repeat protein